MLFGFLAVALLAEAVFASVTLLTERHDVSIVAVSQRASTTDAVVLALSNAYSANAGWYGAAVEPAVALATAAGAGFRLESVTGNTLLQAGRVRLFGATDAIPVSQPVKADGRVVGRVALVFPTAGSDPAEQRLTAALARAVALSAAIAAAVAVAAALAVAHGLLSPVRRLSAAARAIGAGTTGVRVGGAKGPVELEELAGSFDRMAASLDKHEALRRALVADIAHELRTPIAVLQAETESLVDGVRRRRQMLPGSASTVHWWIWRRCGTALPTSSSSGSPQPGSPSSACWSRLWCGATRGG
jgi:signal transduction histidine kinase